jgi:hypothetical protein
MTSPDNILYYSAGSYLAYIISAQFYKQHYLWCSPVFNPASLSNLDPRRNIPASSSPHDIYASYKRDVDTNDSHSSLISQNRLGLKRGAKHKLAAGVITQNEYQMIMLKIKMASISDFRPLLYLIPASMVKDKMAPVPIKLIANPLGSEYRIDCLIDGEFEILEFIR